MPARKRSQCVERCATKTLELRRIPGRTVKQVVALGEPERWNLGAIDTLPPELRGRVHAGDSAEKPIRLVTGQLQNLGHLRIVSKGVEVPAYRHIHTQLVPVVTLAVKDLPHERLTAGHVHVRHDVGAAHQLESALFHELSESRRVFGVALQIRPHIGDLVEHEAIFGMLCQQVQRRGNVYEAHLQVFLAGLKDCTLPVGVRDDPEHIRFRSGILTVGRRRLSLYSAAPHLETQAEARADKHSDDNFEMLACGHRDYGVTVRGF